MLLRILLWGIFSCLLFFTGCKHKDEQQADAATLDSTYEAYDRQARLADRTLREQDDKIAAHGLVLDKAVVHKAPKHGRWNLCMGVIAGKDTTRHSLREHLHAKGDETLPLNLLVAQAQPGKQMTFFLHVDADKEEVCTGEAADKLTSEITFSQKDQKRLQNNNWDLTLYWHWQ